MESVFVEIEIIAYLNGFHILLNIRFRQQLFQLEMADVEIDQSEESSEGDHIAEDRLAKLLNSHHPKRNFFIRAEPGIANRLLGNELVPFLMEPHKYVCLFDHWTFNRFLIVSKIACNSLIPNRGVIIEEEGHFVA